MAQEPSAGHRVIVKNAVNLIINKTVGPYASAGVDATSTEPVDLGENTIHGETWAGDISDRLNERVSSRRQRAKKSRPGFAASNDPIDTDPAVALKGANGGFGPVAKNAVRRSRIIAERR